MQLIFYFKELNVNKKDTYWAPAATSFKLEADNSWKKILLLQT